MNNHGKCKEIVRICYSTKSKRIRNKCYKRLLKLNKHPDTHLQYNYASVAIYLFGKKNMKELKF